MRPAFWLWAIGSSVVGIGGIIAGVDAKQVIPIIIALCLSFLAGSIDGKESEAEKHHRSLASISMEEVTEEAARNLGRVLCQDSAYHGMDTGKPGRRADKIVVNPPCLYHFHKAERIVRRMQDAPDSV